MKKHGRASWLCVIAGLLAGAAATEAARGQNFSPPFEAATVVADNQTRFEALLDYDGDGRMDAVSVWFPTTVSVRVRGYRNDGAGRLVPDWSVTYTGIVNLPNTGPSGVLAAGDFNADGRGDFVLTLNEYVGYWISNGAGVVPTITNVFAESTIVNELVAADFDGDGRTDVAVREGLNVRLFMTQPFGAPVMTSSAQVGNSGTAHIFLTEGNGDGLPDLGGIAIGGLLGTSANAVLFAAPAGILQSTASFTFTNVMSPMTVSGDIDQDGDVDVVAFSMGQTTPTPMAAMYQVARRTGPTAFNVEPQGTGGPATGLADIDLDGDLDGVCCSSGGGGPAPNAVVSKFELSFNDGTGSFFTAFEIAGLGATHLAGAVDFDGDGDIDLIAGRCIYYGRGTGGLPPFPSSFGVAGPRDIADVDGDGDMDARPGLASFQANAGNGLFSVTPVIAPAAPAGTAWQFPGFPGDFDGDGDVDLLIDLVPAGQAPNGTHLLRNLGSGAYVDAGLAVPPGTTMSLLPGTYFGTQEQPENSLTSDLDGDGDLDIVIRSTVGAITYGSGNSKVWWNQGTGTFVPGQDFVDIVVVHAGDIDQDGVIDLVAHQHLGGGYSELVVMRGTGGTFLPPGPGTDIDTHVVNRPAVADLDGDGDLDIFSVGNNSAKRYTNLGGGVFTGAITFGAASAPSRTSVYPNIIPHLAFALDVDGDGLVDVVTTPIYDVPNGMAILLNPVLNTTTPATAAPIIQVFQPRAFADLDGDGDLDAVGLTLAARNARFGPIGAGYRAQYGAGIPGAGGITPVVGDVGPFRSGSAGELRIRGGLGGAAAILVIGSSPANTPMLGGTLLVNPAAYFPIQLGGIAGAPGAGSHTISWVMPASLVGASIYHQVGVVDPAAPSGISASNGLRVDVGP